MDFEPGQQVGGLRIRRELGRGAYGVVYLAEDSLLGRKVALKVLPGPVSGGPVPAELRDEALNEARLIANLKSPSIVTLYRLRSADDGGWMMEMEFVGGGSLEEEMTEGEPLPLPRALEILRGICLALKAAHGARVIHGDIKPANVMFDADRAVKLADFGLARIVESGQGSVDLEGQALGTPAYMAPEVLTGQETGIGADLWAVGVLSHQLLSGRLPFPATNMAELWNAVMESDPDPLPVEVPEPLAELVRSCLAQDLRDRPASASALLDELDRLAQIDRRLAPGEQLRERPTNVGDDPSSFVGRERELDDLRALLTDEQTRLVTLAGPGGMGKTRTSRQLCRNLLDHFEGGCWFADLSEARTENGVAQAVAHALGVTLSGESPPAENVGGVLQYRKPMLLVLDNFEQVTATAPATVGAWREIAPEVRFLVTSRATLGLGGERLYDLSPLPTPDEGADPAAALATDGVRLFLDRAPSLDPNDEDLLAIARISRELDGIPLAIELAAARASILKPRQIADKLTQRFQLLRTSRTDVAARQKTLLGAIEWSFNLLDDAERSAFLQASVFRGGFFLDAAEEIMDLGDVPDAPFPMDLVQSLRDKSLLRAYDAGLETRIDMYRSIRDYARTKWLAAATEAQQQALLDRHATHYLAVADEWNGRLLGARGRKPSTASSSS